MGNLEANPDRNRYAPARVRSVLWHAGLFTTALGVIALGARARLLGLATATIGGATLSLLSLATELRVVLRADDDQFVKFSIVATGAAVFVTATAIGSGIFPIDVQFPVRIVVITLGLQALLLTVDVRPVGTTQRGRLFLLMVTHVAVFGGSLLVLPFGPTDFRAAVLMHSAGFSFLILHAFWMRRLRPGVSPPKPETSRRHWESVLLFAILTGIAATLGVVTTTRGTVPNSPFSTALATIAGLAATMLLASLSVPRTSPLALHSRTATFRRRVVSGLRQIAHVLLARSRAGTPPHRRGRHQSERNDYLFVNNSGRVCPSTTRKRSSPSSGTSRTTTRSRR